MARRKRQLGFVFRTWGGKRKGAGRRPNGENAGVSHRVRPVLKKRFPVHVTLRMNQAVWSLRSRRCFTALSKAFWGGADRFGFRLVHYSVQGNHMHLLVEAEDQRALSRGMNGLGVRIARALNRVMERQGKVFADRYHAHILRTPTEVRHVRKYLLTNARKHYNLVGPDPFTSTVALIAPDTFLLRRHC
jgi:putative transposase